MRVAVTGASGLIGNAVARELRGRGDEVLRLVRARAAARAPDAVYWD
ncbi:MAG: NAD-dependent epimerase/dehydratase family protein, partial [Longimicrobiales bacterium]